MTGIRGKEINQYEILLAVVIIARATALLIIKVCLPEMAKNLDTLLYLCPRCGATYEMDCQGNTMRCRRCGNTEELDEYYQLHAADGSECPALVTDWTLLERQRAASLSGREVAEYRVPALRGLNRRLHDSAVSDPEGI